MSKQKNNTEKKTNKTEKDLEKQPEYMTDEDVFDHYCYNDYCTTYSLTGEREPAICFKHRFKNQYLIYCSCCGEGHKLTKEEFVLFQKKISTEKDLASKVVQLKFAPQERPEEPETSSGAILAKFY